MFELASAFHTGSGMRSQRQSLIGGGEVQSWAGNALNWSQVPDDGEVVNSSPLTKGGYRGVLDQICEAP